MSHSKKIKPKQLTKNKYKHIMQMNCLHLIEWLLLVEVIYTYIHAYLYTHLFSIEQFTQFRTIVGSY